jgi:hypothetical protein
MASLDFRILYVKATPSSHHLLEDVVTRIFHRWVPLLKWLIGSSIETQAYVRIMVIISSHYIKFRRPAVLRLLPSRLPQLIEERNRQIR